MEKVKVKQKRKQQSDAADGANSVDVDAALGEVGEGEKPVKSCKRSKKNKAVVPDAPEDGKGKIVPQTSISEKKSENDKQPPPRLIVSAKAEEDGPGGIDALLKLRSLLAPPGSVEAGAAKEATVVTTSAKGTVVDETTATGPELAVEPASDKQVAPADVAGDEGHAGEDAPQESSSAPAGPDWTSRYCVVNSADPPTPLEQLKWPLHPVIERSLRKGGYNALFPIQVAVIPLLSRSAETSYDSNSPYACDVCVAAPTGQGKTLAYAIPVVQALLGRLRPTPRCLVILPTRDLAMQVFRVFQRLLEGLGKGVTQISIHCLIGQKSFAEERRALKARPADVVVCTPGRLSDHVLGREGRLDLGALRWFVVDEADRLLSQASHRWLDVLERVAPNRDSDDSFLSASFALKPQPQKLLLSATMTWNPQKLAMLNLRRAMFFISSQTGQYSTPKQLKQHWLTCATKAKPLAVLHLLASILRRAPGSQTDSGASGGRVVIFCSSVDTSHRLARLLQILALIFSEQGSLRERTGEEEEEEAGGSATRKRGTTSLALPPKLRESGAVAEFSSTLTQPERNALLAKFRKAVVNCLVCSDVVARGIDIPEVQAVINYSAPEHLATYIHRCGRTARAGRSGETYTFVMKPHMDQFESMLRESADCWERIQEFKLPLEATDTRQLVYARGLSLLEDCLHLENKGHLPPGRPLTKEDLQTVLGQTPSADADATKVEAEDEESEEPQEASTADKEDEDVEEPAVKKTKRRLTSEKAERTSKKPKKTQPAPVREPVVKPKPEGLAETVTPKKSPAGAAGSQTMLSFWHSVRHSL